MPKRKAPDVPLFASPLPGTEFATIVRDSPLPANRRHTILWCFCELCGRQTEYAVAVESVGIYKRLKKGDAKAVPLTEAMCTKAQKAANDLVMQYQEALAGHHGPYAVARLLHDYCNMREMGGDRSVDAFRDQVERYARISEWARHGDLFAAPRLPGTSNGAQRPSKLYCDLHYPRRSVAARRAYQRDRRFVVEYEEVVRELWSQYAGHLRDWHIDDHALVRHAAYHAVRVLKAPTICIEELPLSGSIAMTQTLSRTPREKSIEDYYAYARAAFHYLRHLIKPDHWLDDLQKNEITNQSEIARLLGVSRQAVSAALKRKANRRAPVED